MTRKLNKRKTAHVYYNYCKVKHCISYYYTYYHKKTGVFLLILSIKSPSVCTTIVFREIMKDRLWFYSDIFRDRLLLSENETLTLTIPLLRIVYCTTNNSFIMNYDTLKITCIFRVNRIWSARKQFSLMKQLNSLDGHFIDYVEVGFPQCWMDVRI